MNKILSVIIALSLGLNFFSPQTIKAQAKEIESDFFVNPSLENSIDEKGVFLINGNTLAAINLDFPLPKETVKETIDEQPKTIKLLAKKEIQKPISIQNSKERTVSLTAYSSTVFQCDGDPFTTASGTRVKDGTVAANFLPFGTTIQIPDIFGNKVFVVEDRMARRFSNTVDIWMSNYQSAIQFGKVRSAKIVILD